MCGNTALPPLVNRTPSCPRSNNARPSSSSNRPTRRLIVDVSIRRDLAARVKLPAAADASRYMRSRISMSDRLCKSHSAPPMHGSAAALWSIAEQSSRLRSRNRRPGLQPAADRRSTQRRPSLSLGLASWASPPVTRVTLPQDRRLRERTRAAPGTLRDSPRLQASYRSPAASPDAAMASAPGRGFAPSAHPSR